MFLICAEYLSSTLYKAEEHGKIIGIGVCKRAPSINHLLSADDSLLLFKAENRTAVEIDYILESYAACLGQIVNKEKSAIMFSKNVQVEQNKMIMSALHITREARAEKYLGLPVYIGRSKEKVFTYLKDKIWRKI